MFLLLTFFILPIGRDRRGLILILHVLELDLEEVALIKWLDHELGPILSPLTIPKRVRQFNVEKFFHLSIVHIVGKVEAILDLKVPLGLHMCGIKHRRWRHNR